MKHIHELIHTRREGYWCSIAFVVQMPTVKEVRPNVETHPAFGVAWQEAVAAGVRIWFLGCDVREDELTVDKDRLVVET